jgi:hypothetical protein
MVTVHETVGSLVVLAFIALVVVNVLRATGRTIGFAKPLSFAASGLLLLQYALGFSLLGGESKISAWHYLIALAAIVPVGAEHMMANSQTDSRAAGRIGAIVNVATLALVLIAYMIGMNNA